MATLDRLSSALAERARPGTQPRDILQQIQNEYPDVTMREVARAAYYAVLELDGEDFAKVDLLHDLATRARMSEN